MRCARAVRRRLRRSRQTIGPASGRCARWDSAQLDALARGARVSFGGVRRRASFIGIALAIGLVGAGACERKRGPDGGADAAAGLAASAPAAAAPSAPDAAASDGDASVAGSGKPRSACPAEMALINGRFCIDRWEASSLDPDGSEHSPYKGTGPSRARAVSRAGVVPQAYVSAQEAELGCKRSGKKLCTSQQWQDACMGVARPHRVFPYGMQEKKGACNTSRRLHPVTRLFGSPRLDAISLADPRINQLDDTVAKTGEFASCVTPEGVFDLQGNLLEWTLGPEKPLLLGGHYVDAVKHGRGCEYVTAGHGDRYGDYTTGFRCCMPADKSAPAPAPAAVPDAGPASAPLASGESRDPPGMRGFTDALGKLPALAPPAYEPAGAACPVDMTHVEGLRCSVPIQRCKRWLPRLSVGQKIACAEFEEPSECEGVKRRLDYCIDTREFTPPGYTYPLTHVNWGEAQNLCHAMDKRLCLEAEWEFACEGPDALPFPYGYVRDGKRCNHDFPEEELVTAPDQFIDRRVAADALPECKSPFGVLNMVGNVDEWTTREGREKPRRAILRGGWWLVGRNRCRAATDNHSELYAGVQTGFRCCKAARKK